MNIKNSQTGQDLLGFPPSNLLRIANEELLKEFLNDISDTVLNELLNDKLKYSQDEILSNKEQIKNVLSVYFRSVGEIRKLLISSEENINFRSILPKINEIFISLKVKLVLDGFKDIEKIENFLIKKKLINKNITLGNMQIKFDEINNLIEIYIEEEKKWDDKNDKVYGDPSSNANNMEVIGLQIKENISFLKNNII